MDKKRLLEIAGVIEAPYRAGSSPTEMLVEAPGAYRWELGDMDLGERDFGQGTLEQMLWAARKFATKHVSDGRGEIRSMTAQEVRDQFHDSYGLQPNQGWLLTPAGADVVGSDNELPDGSYIVGTWTQSP